MKRDFDVIRGILLLVEATGPGPGISPNAADGQMQGEVDYNAMLLIDEGLLDGRILSRFPPIYQIITMTWAGHDFLDASRDNTTWNKAKSTLLAKGGTVTLEVLKAWLISEMKARIGLPS